MNYLETFSKMLKKAVDDGEIDSYYLSEYYGYPNSQKIYDLKINGLFEGQWDQYREGGIEWLNMKLENKIADRKAQG